MFDYAFLHIADSAVAAKYLHTGTVRPGLAAARATVFSQRTRGWLIYLTLKVKSKEAEVALLWVDQALCSNDNHSECYQKGKNVPTIQQLVLDRGKVPHLFADLRFTLHGQGPFQ